MTAFSAILAYWRWPFVLKESYYDGAWNVETTVRRGWDGRLYHYGPAIRSFANAKKAVETEIYGVPLGPIEREPGTNYWHEDGRKLNSRESEAYWSLEYLPRHLDGEPIMTEPEWREHLLENKAEYDKIDADFENAMTAIGQDK